MKKILFVLFICSFIFISCNKAKTNDILGTWYSVTNAPQPWTGYSYFFSDITFTKPPKSYETTFRDNFGSTIRDIKSSWKWVNNGNSIVFDVDSSIIGGASYYDGYEVEVVKLTSDSLWLFFSANPSEQHCFYR